MITLSETVMTEPGPNDLFLRTNTVTELFAFLIRTRKNRVSFMEQFITYPLSFCVPFFCSFGKMLKKYCHVLVTRHGVWFNNWIY
jgi:hypothetical protein